MTARWTWRRWSPESKRTCMTALGPELMRFGVRVLLGLSVWPLAACTQLPQGGPGHALPNSLAASASAERGAGAGTSNQLAAAPSGGAASASSADTNSRANAQAIGLAYYWQAVAGHLGVMRAARPVPDWLADPSTPPLLAQRLALSQRIRDFASTSLGLPDNASYRSYADLGRSAAVWNVVAAPADSLTLKTWCFPVAGCVGYRGYYSEAQARALGADLRAQGWDVSVYGVPAYSTLGWLNWLGGDPLLNTFIHQPPAELARLVFHELAHQQVYAADDTAFNESYATAVERLGLQAWLALPENAAARAEYDRFDQRRQDWRALHSNTRQALAALYDRAAADPQAAARLSADKAAVLQAHREAYLPFRERLVAELAAGAASAAGIAGEAKEARAARDSYEARVARESYEARVARVLAFYDSAVAEANNASFGVQGVYDQWVPAFEALFQQSSNDWPSFHQAVRQMAARPKTEREQALKALMPGPSS
jgi:predicted aminopeptidase